MSFKRNVTIVFLVVFLAMIVTSAVLAEGKIDRKKVKLLKWVGPGQPDTYEQYMANRPKGPFKIKREDNQSLRASEKVLVIANSSIYSSLETEILRYANSLIACGYDAPVYQSSHGTAEDLKNFIKNNQTNLIGCVFIGDLPAAWYEVANDFGQYGYASFPCDLFFMDLDGNWIDSDSDGLYDDHTNGSGDREPEIFVGRIDLSRMAGNEVDNLRSFFDRDNEYWTGNMNLVKYGLTYTEDDWTEYPEFLHDISDLYGSDYQAIAAPNTNESDYRNYRLADISYEFIQLSCHSSATLHAFTRGGYCYYYEVQAVPPQFLGINMFCCSSNRFTTNNFLGAAYLHHSGPKALSVIGSTKTGSMLDFSYFYTPLGENKSMGVAFKEWFEAIAPYDMDDVYWHYGMAIVGDPMITFLSVCVGNHPPTADFTYTTNLLTVDFTDQSSDSDGTIVSWDWDFGDGGSSTQQNPSYTYGASGTYTVTLTVTDNGGATDSVPKDVTVSSTVPDPPVADFSASTTTVEEGQDVTFTDLSSNDPTSWSWTFDGGTPGTSSDQNPTITYNTAGTYTVSLTATNSAGSDTETKTDYITVTAAPLTVGYTTVFGSTSTSANRRAMPFTMPEDGTITSVTMYHTGGSGNMILGVYDGEGTPQSRLGVTAETAVSGSTGWQTISLTSPAFIYGGTTVWLAWVYQSNPGIRYQTGSPGRYQSSDTWSGGMPDPFGSGSQSNYLYSIYATYTPGGGPAQYTLTTYTVGQGSITLDPAGGTYNEGTIVTLTAEPDSGWQFDEWSGDLSGSQNPTTITMDSDKTVTATFSEVIIPQYTLTVNTVGQGSVTLDPPGGTYDEGTVVTLTAEPASGWQFDEWSGDLTGSQNPTTITMDSDKTVTATFSEIGTTGTVGNEQVFSSTTTTTNRRAMPFTMPEDGNITSVTMYHIGGSGNMILGVYGGESSPQNRLGVTPETAVNSSTGWQTISLTNPAFVAGGSTVWLAWVYESNPGIAYQSGSPGRVDAGEGWSGGMPDPFGSSSQANYVYSIYATYTPGGSSQGTVGNTTVFGSTTTTTNRRAMPFTMPEDGTINSVSMYHTGGSGDMILAVYDGASTPQNRIAVTATTAVSGSTGWQTINLTSPVFVTSGTTIWLAWVYESNPGIRYQTGSPGRFDAGVGWSGGMPDPFGSGSQANYLYSIYATYTK